MEMGHLGKDPGHRDGKARVRVLSASSKRLGLLRLSRLLPRISSPFPPLAFPSSCRALPTGWALNCFALHNLPPPDRATLEGACVDSISLLHFRLFLILT